MAVKGKIEVNGLQLFAHHGVLPQERTVGNTFEVSVHLGYPVEAATESDSIETTLNYAEVVELVKEVMATPSQLLERAAYRIYEAIIMRWPLVTDGTVTVKKLTPPIPAQLRDVAITLEW